MDVNPPPGVADDVTRALAEDLGSGDLTAGLIAPSTRAHARVVCREAAVLCGQPWVEQVFAQLSSGITLTWHVAEGGELDPGSLVCEARGPARALLSGERTALNFLQTLSGTATVARRYAQTVRGTGCKILDTRKTIPGLRAAQKYATRVGGAQNHRMGLYDGILIKENHIIACGGIAAAVSSARASSSSRAIEVEVENLAELREAVAAGADILLLDNFSLAELEAAVGVNTALAAELGRSPARLEASGNVTEAGLAALAASGVDYISVGALTKHVQAVDFSMRFELD